MWNEVRQPSAWRHLRSEEISVLRSNGCTSSAGVGFGNVGVLTRDCDGFDPSRVVGCHFGGKLNVLGRNHGTVCGCTCPCNVFGGKAGGALTIATAIGGGSGGGGGGGASAVVATTKKSQHHASSLSSPNCHTPLPAGVYHSNLVDVVILGDARVSQCTLISQVLIEGGAWVEGCGVLARGSRRDDNKSATTTTANNFGGNNIKICVGNSTGGRELTLFADLSYDQACAQVCRHGADALLGGGSNANINSTGGVMSSTSSTTSTSSTSTTSATSSSNESASLGGVGGGIAEATNSIIGAHCRVLHCTRADDFVMGAGAIVEGSTIHCVTLLSSEDERVHVVEGSVVSESIVQWGAQIRGNSVVERSLICEQAHIDRHAKVLDSVIGPCSGVAEGECANSLMGPLVGFHHQALLIAAVWPEGKGNIGHGASVGSNHTGKSPDQELWPGEGVFFGLAVCIKFPSSYVDAPYSIIAAGAKTLPEKVKFPFSLINSAGESFEGVSPAFNEIIPAWVLSDSIYTILRNDSKFSSRFTAKRCRIETSTFRPLIVNKMVAARRALVAAEGKGVQKGKTVLFLENHVPGLGKNYMTEKTRQNAIAAYTQYIRHYALMGIVRELESLRHSGRGAMDQLLRTASHTATQSRWQHELAILQMEYKNVDDITFLANECVASFRRVAADCKVSKQRDHERGARITPGYVEVHVAASDDKVVLAAEEQAEKVAQLMQERGIRLSRL